jgi:hypothetical protein
LPNTASELANTSTGFVPRARGRFQQRVRGVEVAAHAEVEVGLAFAADGRRQVEDGVGAGGGQVARLSPAPAGRRRRTHARVGAQVGRRLGRGRSA